MFVQMYVAKFSSRFIPQSLYVMCSIRHTKSAIEILESVICYDLKCSIIMIKYACKIFREYLSFVTRHIL
jgi:hypothetical protein